MPAKVLTVEAAKAANIEVIENGKYTQVVHDTVTALRANRRSGTASTKTKATVSGSGAKPWRQKGTGRARAGYKSSPVWVGGGVVFGPHPRDYSKKVAKSVKRIALRKALSERIKSGDVLIVDSFGVDKAKTKGFIVAVSAITEESRTLIISAAFDDKTYLAGRNVKPTLLITAAEVNTEQLLSFRKIIVTNDGLAQLAERIAKK
ncbi:MAG: large subunit ribosomal protein [Chthoniobacter sp.]|jgi:large subunit ribosomal protein L4|nr:large subunit ribosomal protein [Chthoniobacter sp.]